jgi:prepilin-type N-terminal cleavage/methylation domain-containing protein
MMSCRRYLRSRRGFTLLEVLVALTILSLGVVTLLQIFSLGLRLGARSAVRTESAADGARVMDELLARKKLPEGGESGTLQGTGRWQAQVQTVRDSPFSLSLSNNWELKELAVELYGLEGRRERLLDLKTFRLSKKANP